MLRLACSVIRLACSVIMPVIGSMLPSLVDGNVKGESSSTSNKESDANKDVRAVTSSPSDSTGDTDSTSCGTLEKLPGEVRNMIYSHVLRYDFHISLPHRFLGRYMPIRAEEAKHVLAIDAALLRTCKDIYSETIHILYGSNCFVFFHPSDMKEFAHTGLGATPFGSYNKKSTPSDAISNARYGRLAMVQHVIVSFCNGMPGNNTEQCSSWFDFFYPPEKQDQLVGFPALLRLTLDFTQWQLDRQDASEIRVCPITGIFSHLNHLFGCLDARALQLGFARQKKPPPWHFD